MEKDEKTGTIPSFDAFCSAFAAAAGNELPVGRECDKITGKKNEKKRGGK
ncbi:MAG: hypothetical protein IKD01_04505 [Oscillospiraceae bacterium]|nr:hypothetical protein [Oscillospiraceae bacterium]